MPSTDSATLSCTCTVAVFLESDAPVKMFTQRVTHGCRLQKIQDMEADIAMAEKRLEEQKAELAS